MSQNDLAIANQGFASFRSDLNSALQALGSTNSGTSAPSTTYANQLFYNTADNVLAIRNEDNDAFITLFTLDQTNDNIESLTISGALTFTGDLIASTAGISNFRAGVNAGNSIASGGNYNTVIGDEAGTALTTGDNNVAIGYQALDLEDTGSNSVAIGRGALSTQNIDGISYNVAIGYGAGNLVSTGESNTIVGANAGDALNTGSNNVAIGNFALSAEDGHGRNIAIGRNSLLVQNAGQDAYNTAIGYNTGATISTGIKNTIIGGLAGDVLTDADFNVAVGYGALSEDHKGSRSTAIGAFTLEAQEFASSTNSFNTAVGYNAGALVTTGIQNTFVGNEAGDGVVTGARNTAFGNRALSGAVDDSNNNTCIGMDAGTVTTGNNNTFVGAYNGSSGGCGSLVTSGSNNTILGSYNGNQSSLDIRTGSNNIVLSDGAGNARMHINSDGDVGIGTVATGVKLTVEQESDGQTVCTFTNTSSSNPYGIFMDFSAGTPDNNSNYYLKCMDGGNTTRVFIYSDGDIQNHDNSYSAVSDEKLKEQITDASSQWDDIKALTVRKFKMKEDVAKGDSDANWRLGVIAQEVETAGMNGLVRDNPDLDKDNEDLGTTTKSVKYSILYMKAVKALQEAMTRIETLESKVATLEG